MMSIDSILEEQRSRHEERERLEEAMVLEMNVKKSSRKEEILSDHKLRYLLDRYKRVTQELVEYYEDKECNLKKELNDLSSSSDLISFYSRLKSIKSFYAVNPDEIILPLETSLQEAIKSQVHVVFRDEESNGRFLDLNHCFNLYINMKGVSKTDYVTYLSNVTKLDMISPSGKQDKDYRKYLKSLFDYLHDFVGRTRPLVNIDVILDNHIESTVMVPSLPLNLKAFSSIEEVASLGLDKLKAALLAKGLKCGGSLMERAERLWKTRDDNSSLEQLKRNPNSDLKTLEAKVSKLLSILHQELQNTIENVQRKQGRLESESDEEDSEGNISSEEETDNEVIYNPKNLPLGWDGKPIPYWLYKLHGLNMTFSCEICGNNTYKGPKGFQKHFSEWRHSNGMRSLGIPNTAQFANVTKIEDALSLWRKIQEDRSQDTFKEEEQQFEDNEGRVVSKKTYDDLKRQGLL
jgi:splicing factor 3A subunit 3